MRDRWRLVIPLGMSVVAVILSCVSLYLGATGR